MNDIDNDNNPILENPIKTLEEILKDDPTYQEELTSWTEFSEDLDGDVSETHHDSEELIDLMDEMYMMFTDTTSSAIYTPYFEEIANNTRDINNSLTVIITLLVFWIFLSRLKIRGDD